jgi:2,3-bisphosphoglycerate-independent phosphoglycerate mutase
MKYAIIIPDGASDDPLPQLGGRTPLEVAQKPNIDWVARHGRLGSAQTIPPGFESGSDVAIMSLLGYDPAQYHSGRAPLEAAAQRIPLQPTDWVFRCNLVTVTEGVMKDHSAGGISNAESRQLIGDLAADLAKSLPDYELHCGVSYRNLMVYRGRQSFALSTTPPHEIPELPAEAHWPRGQGSQVLRQIMARSAELFAAHPVNQLRASRGQRIASQVWFWGQGKAPRMPAFAQRFGLARGCMISSVDLLRGLAVLLGWDVHDVPGMTSFHDTNYVGQGQHSAAALDEYDLVFSHVEAPDEASHQADWKTKIAAIEHIDRHIVGPLLEKLRTFPQWRLLVMPDHATHVGTRKHGYAPAPFCIAGSDLAGGSGASFTESSAASGVKIERGHELMEYFLRG